MKWKKTKNIINVNIYLRQWQLWFRHVGIITYDLLHIIASDIQQGNPLASYIQQGTSINARAEVDPYLVLTYCSIIPYSLRRLLHRNNYVYVYVNIYKHYCPNISCPCGLYWLYRSDQLAPARPSPFLMSHPSRSTQRGNRKRDVFFRLYTDD